MSAQPLEQGGTDRPALRLVADLEPGWVQLPGGAWIEEDNADDLGPRCARPSWSASFEDYDPEPVPTGCPGCYLREKSAYGRAKTEKCRSCPLR